MSVLMAIALAAAAPADSDLLELATPQQIVAAMQQAGYRADLKKENGVPLIDSAANGSPFVLYLYDCETGKCSGLDFQAMYRPDPFYTAELANEWNSSNRFLKISVNPKGELREWVHYSVVGKVTRANFKNAIAWFTEMDVKLTRFLEAKRAAATEAP
ncbi:YbjN domain-containing protein [Sphingomonas immobilis]|uniref:YbjN domain-containing protein n=1 Tax=Sphingomonas immobilis TaxID=3063997 RepID=A0ABT9A3R4_9SPHN|nr:YbjN domain-containing protein [Sphingomonas sp. CA1-15]MDO7844479.1 YbjN domain-containing protein [Sphingomonas sp. CA1-15]